MTLVNPFVSNIFMGLKAARMLKFLILPTLLTASSLSSLSSSFPPVISSCFYQGSRIMSTCLSQLSLKSPVKSVIHQSTHGTHCTKPCISNTKYLRFYKLIQSSYNLIITVSEDSPRVFVFWTNALLSRCALRVPRSQFNPRFDKPHKAFTLLVHRESV